jgi:hypothetical protein
MLQKRFYVCILLCTFLHPVFSQSRTILEEVLRSSDTAIQRVVKNLEKHQVQIVLTQVEKMENKRVQFETTSFQLDESFYFYPASTVKLPIAVLALQKIRALQRAGIPIDIKTSFQVYDAEETLIAANDSTHPEGHLTIAHLIKKIFLVSDNTAYNYLFDFLGRDYINKELYKKGLKQTQLSHKSLYGENYDTNLAFIFYDLNGKPIYTQPSISSHQFYSNTKLKGIKKGLGHIKEGQYIASPMDFSKKNRSSLLNLEGILKRVVFPEVFASRAQFELEASDYEFLKYWMSRTTLESSIPDYNTGDYWDSYVKFFIYGDQKGKMNDQLRIYNKVGLAYGTLTDIAFIEDKKSGLCFFLSATLLVNQNEIFNDDLYEYEGIGIPFLAALGREVLDQLRIKRTNSPIE